METMIEKRCDRLKRIRGYLRLTQEEFGSPLGLNQTKIRDLESGKVKISTLHSIAIEKIHGVNMNWLLTGEGEMFVGEGREEKEPVRQEEPEPTRQEITPYQFKRLFREYPELKEKLAFLDMGIAHGPKQKAVGLETLQEYLNRIVGIERNNKNSVPPEQIPKKNQAV